MLESLLRETDWLDALRRTDEPVLLYGMGSGADKILALLSGAGIRVAGVFASDGFVRGHSYRRMRVLTRREAEERFGSFTALLAFGLEGGPDEALRAVASRHRLLAPNLPVYGAGRLDKAYIRQNAARILYVYERLADDYSKRLFYELLRYDVNGDPRALLAMESRCDPPPSYFAHGRAHIDVGAHDGATLRDYHAVSPAHGPLLAVEPDRIAFRRLCEAVSDLPLARPIRAAASDREGRAFFAGGQGRGSAGGAQRRTVRWTASAAAAGWGSRTSCASAACASTPRARTSACSRRGQYALRGRATVCAAVYHRAFDLVELPRLLLRSRITG
ncbi:MAG: hypothetical protein ACLUFV_06470 [Acutalibacteraceae bacterium]